MPIPVPGRAAEHLRRACVQIFTTGARHNGNGSGIVLPNERVLTNAHVARGSRLMVQSWEGQNYNAVIIKSDARRDLALLSVAGLRSPSVSLGDSDRLRSGTAVFAVGNPLGFVGAVSSGVVHSIGPLPAMNGLPWDLHWIQADVRLAPGNSGGPLATFDGQVVGLNTMVISGGLSLAIPSRTAEAFIARSGEAPKLGITIRPITTKAGQFGLMILEVEEGSAANSASLLPGDIVVGAAGRPFRYVDDLDDALLKASSPMVTLDFYRGGTNGLRHVAVQLRRGAVASAA
jgi:serine protease Do